MRRATRITTDLNTVIATIVTAPTDPAVTDVCIAAAATTTTARTAVVAIIPTRATATTTVPNTRGGGSERKMGRRVAL